MTKNQDYLESSLNYMESLETLKNFFTSPVSNPIMDGYFTHTLSRFLDHIDNLKCKTPVLGLDIESCLDFNLHKVDIQTLPMRIKQEGKYDIWSKFPNNMSSVEDVTELLTEYAKGIIIWSHPNTQVNVIPPSTIPSIMAFIAASTFNPSIDWDEYSGNFADAEIQSVAMMSDLVGYNQNESGGIFTFGGTGSNLYACKLGVENIFDGKLAIDGIREDVKIITSDMSHYSKLNITSWLGIGTKNIVNIPTKDNAISIEDLENYLGYALNKGEKIAAILATMGTTDAFGIDDLKSIVELRDKLYEEFKLGYRPWIHADAAIGWPWIVFKDYDFDKNSLGFNSRTLYSIKESITKMISLNMADSISIDFHKIGYTPYISSLFLLKDRRHLNLITRAKESMPYMYQFGHYHPGVYTLETSRPGSGCLAALANIILLGKQGYRVLIGHLVEMAQMLRDKLEKYPFIKILNSNNHGPVTLFRIYPDSDKDIKHEDVDTILQKEIKDPEYRKQLDRNNRYNINIFQFTHEKAMKGEGVLLSLTIGYRHAEYKDGPPIAALKSFIMSPWTDIDSIDTVVHQVTEARKQIKIDNL